MPETWIGRPPSASSEHPSAWTGEQEAPLVLAVLQVGEEQHIADCTATAAVLGVMLHNTHDILCITQDLFIADIPVKLLSYTAAYRIVHSPQVLHCSKRRFLSHEHVTKEILRILAFVFAPRQ